MPDSQKKSSCLAYASGAPVRLDAFLRSRFSHLSLAQIRGAIEAGEVRVNGRRGSKGRILFPGDVVSFPGSSLWREKSPLPNPGLRIEILYEDEALIVLEKPAGMSCHGFSGKDTQTLANFLLARYPFLGTVGKSVWEPGLVHRLDRDTSGVLLAAKNQDAFEDLRAQFHRQSVRKRYVALVWGSTPDREVLSHPLAHDPKDKRKMRVLQSPANVKLRAKRWKAVTRFETLCRRNGLSFIEVELYTGVTHQIRAHLEAAGYPIVGDPLYGGAAPPSKLGRQFLHASGLDLVHPRTGRKVAFESGLPADLRRELDRIGIHPL